MKANLEMEGPGHLDGGEGNLWLIFFYRIIFTQNGNYRFFVHCSYPLKVIRHRYCLTHAFRTHTFIWLMSDTFFQRRLIRTSDRDGILLKKRRIISYGLLFVFSNICRSFESLPRIAYMYTYLLEHRHLRCN